MGSQWSRDKVYLRAKHEGFRSRASFKLIEIQDKFAIIRRDDNIIDLGAAPGSWLQVLRTLTDGRVLGIDLNPIATLEGIDTIEGDLTEPVIQQKALEMLGSVSVVVCDAAPKLSGHKSYDQARAIALGEEALAFACNCTKARRQLCDQILPGCGFSRTPWSDKRALLCRENVLRQSNPQGEYRDLCYRKELQRLKR